MITQTNRDFIGLLRPAITGEPAPAQCAPDASLWREFYSLARIHKVQGLMYRAVVEAGDGFCENLPVETAAALLSDADVIRNTCEGHRRAVAGMEKLWRDCGVRAFLVKGLEAAAAYPHPELRVLGDIDWWIPSRDDWKKADEAVRKLGAKPVADSDGDIHYEWDGIVIEHHRTRMDGDAHVLHHACVKGAEFRHVCDCAASRRSLAGANQTPCPRRWTEIMDSVSEFILTGKEPSRDGSDFLEMTLSGAGTVRRAFFCLRICPGYMLRRIAGLVLGRIKRIFYI